MIIISLVFFRSGCYILRPKIALNPPPPPPPAPSFLFRRSRRPTFTRHGPVVRLTFNNFTTFSPGAGKKKFRQTNILPTKRPDNNNKTEPPRRIIISGR